jgi:PST family polysaccharide transporter
MSLASPQPRSMLARISANFAWGMAAELAAKGSLFLVTLRLADRLTTADFGEFSFMQTVFMFLWMGTDLGLGMYATREVARSPAGAGRFARTFSQMRFFLALALAVPALALIAAFGRGELQLALAAGFSLYLVARAVQLDWLLRGLERYRALAVVNILMGVGVVALTWAMIRGPGDAPWASVPWFVAYLLGTIGIQVMLARDGFRSGPAAPGELHWFAHLRSSIHFTLSNGVSSLYQQLPLLYVYYVASSHETGLYAAPFRVALAFVFVATVFPMTIYPVLTSLHAAGRARAFAALVGASTAAMAAGAGLVAVGAWIFAPEIIRLLFGPRYAEAVPVFQWLAVFGLLRSIRAVFVRGVCAVGHERRYSQVAFASVVVLAIMLAAMTWAGISPLQAASIGLAATEALVTAAMAVLVVLSGRFGAKAGAA